MKTQRRAKYSFAALALAVMPLGCSSTPTQTRVWVDPPHGLDYQGYQKNKVEYKIEDLQSGTVSKLSIPLENAPNQLDIQDQRKKKASKETDVDLALPTQADSAFKSEGKEVKVSYLKGIQKVEELFHRGSYEDALVHLALVLEQYPNQARLYAMQGTLYRKIKENKLALKAYKKAQELDRTNSNYEEAVLRLESEVGGEN